MIPLLVASAFAVMPPPSKVIVFEKPPDDMWLGDWIRLEGGPGTGRIAPFLSLHQKARCTQQESLAVEHRESGFKSGFGPLPPGALPPAPLTSAGFWSMGSPRFSGGGFGKGGMGGFGGGGLGGFGGGGTGGSRGGASGAGGGRGGR